MRNNSYPTMKELAERAGCSTMAVSRAINKPDLVAPELRERIYEEIRKANYSPNMVARALSTGRTNIIYVYIPSDIPSKNPFYLYVIAGIGEALGEKGYSMTVRKSWYGGEPCDGLIIMGLDKEDEEKMADLAASRQVVLFGHVPGIDSIDVNNKEGMEMVGNYLVEKGRKKILYLSINQDRNFVKDRERGIEEAVEGKADLDIAHIPNKTQDSYKFMKESFDYSKGYDAIACASDDMALGVLAALQEKGIKIPEQVSVTGFDGLGSELSSNLRVTTIHQPILEVGIALANRLIQKIESGEITNERNFISPELIIHQTA